MRCLVVSESATARRVLRNALQAAGAGEILEASSAHEALERCEGGVELVLADGELPDLSGLELLKRLRVDTATASTRVVLVTSRNRRQDVLAAAEAGADLYVLKPFALDALADRLARLIRPDSAAAPQEERPAA